MGGRKRGARSGGPCTVPYSGSWTRSVGGSMDRGSLFSGHPRRRELDGVVYSTHPSIQWWRHKPIRQYITAQCIMGRLHNPPLLRITATNIGIFASFAIANNFSSPCAPSLIAVRLVKPAGLSINGCSHSKIKSCVTSENRKLGCRDLKSFTWFSQILLFSFSLKKTKGGSDHRLIVSLMRTFDCILVKVVFLYICLRCVQERTLIFKAKSWHLTSPKLSNPNFKRS